MDREHWLLKQRLWAVEAVLSDPSDASHTAFQNLRRRIEAANTPNDLLATWSADPHAAQEHLGTIVVATIHQLEPVTRVYEALEKLPDDLVAYFPTSVVAEWKTCMECRRATRASLRHLFSGGGLYPLPEDEVTPPSD